MQEPTRGRVREQRREGPLRASHPVLDSRDWICRIDQRGSGRLNAKGSRRTSGDHRSHGSLRRGFGFVVFDIDPKLGDAEREARQNERNGRKRVLTVAMSSASRECRPVLSAILLKSGREWSDDRSGNGNGRVPSSCECATAVRGLSECRRSRLSLPRPPHRADNVRSRAPSRQVLRAPRAECEPRPLGAS